MVDAAIPGNLPGITGFPLPEANSEPDEWSGATISEDRIRALAIGAYYGRSWGAYNDTVAFLPELPGRTDTRREATIEGLHEAWGVDNADDARDTIRRLLAGMHAPLFTVIHPLATAAAAETYRPDRTSIASEHRDFLHTLSKFRGYEGASGLDRDYDAWLQAIKLGITDGLPQPLNTDATAWDLARVGFIARSACTAGYLTEDEAWEHLLAALDQAQQHYRNWRQFSTGFFTGAIFWAATRDLAAAKDQIEERRNMLHGLLVRPSSPWRRVALHPDTPVF
ncbi:DUF1266 domain-containing protein [Nocardia huaxiensis]|uniref:DUF1266 domain-containing protein n=1 Tax=Nocardia huaxiensis TaxID=2755382 RepID=A0A7D6ZLH5_9NOCA|nr:DUF1266 domain-containing protein [Nocardia huaxiensis]QLY32640.1 DUF1266 domain-containing protein [Nocardia huaxiensis]UFS93627.1 DUF1266 domain-containing protein [Nocardia huaxiensis]